MVSINSGRGIIIVWMLVCTGAIAQYFISNVSVIIIITSVCCATTGLYVYRKMGM